MLSTQTDSDFEALVSSVESLQTGTQNIVNRIALCMSDLKDQIQNAAKSPVDSAAMTAVSSDAGRSQSPIPLVGMGPLASRLPRSETVDI